jgi:hypothetical protein
MSSAAVAAAAAAAAAAFSAPSKRLAKRSILGTRVAVRGDDGKFYSGMIQATKTCEEEKSSAESSAENRYSVRFDATRKVREFDASEIVGPGFASVVNLVAGQIVYVTHMNREVQGAVLHHGREQVVIQLLNGGPEVKKKMDEVRLLESRKSARLIGHGTNTDFSKLADFNIVHERKRINSETNSETSATSCRKRHNSETYSDSSGDEYNSGIWSSGSDDRSATPVMSECTAAMVLMNLSFSPGRFNGGKQQQQHQLDLRQNKQPRGGKAQGQQRPEVVVSALHDPIPLNMTMQTLTSAGCDMSVAANVQIDGSVSPSASSGVSSLCSSYVVGSVNSNLTEAEALLQLSNQESDEGIVSDQSSSASSISSSSSSSSDLVLKDMNNKAIKTEHVRIIYQCTWPGCNSTMDVCADIERHIRRRHLNVADPLSEEDNEHEEEFYYNEIEVPLNLTPAKSVAVKKMRHSGPIATYHAPPPSTTSLLAAAAALPVLADHMDMARPAHENPEYYGSGYKHNAVSFQAPAPPQHQPSQQHPVASEQLLPVRTTMSTMPIAIPVANFSFAPPPQQQQQQQLIGVANTQHSSSSMHHGGSAGKYIRLSPKPASSAPSTAASSSSPFGTSPKSPIRRPRGDQKKCRKVYGMEHRELWCTQCKWKKACTRFGPGEMMPSASGSGGGGGGGGMGLGGPGGDT